MTAVQEDALAWQEQSLCAQTDPEIFYPEPGRHGSDAKAICKICDVRDQCLIFALNNEAGEFGIWGGKTESERRRIRRKMKRLSS